MSRLIDLSHIIVPGNAGRKFQIETIGADEVNPNVVRLKNQWYIMHNIFMVNHIGTHIEAPYHLLKNGEDLSQIPLNKLYGEAVILDLKNFPSKTAIKQSQIKKAVENADGIHRGDIVLCNLGYAKYYGKPEYKNNPYFSTDAIKWLVESGIKLMGVDASGIEIPGNEDHINHYTLFKNNIPLIENLNNLDSVDKKRVQLYAFPLSVTGLDSFPLRVVAMEY